MFPNEPQDCPAADVDPFSDEFLSDPFPALAALRDLGDVVFLRKYGVWAVARHDEVNAVLRNPEVFSNASGVGWSNLKKGEGWRSASIILEVDPPMHTRTRRVLSKILSLRAVNELRDGFAAEAASLTDRVVTGGEFDVVTDLVWPFVLKVFPDSLGLPPDDRVNLLTYGGISFNALGPRNDRFDTAMREADELAEWVAAACSRRSLQPGKFGDRLYQAADEGTLTEEEAALLVRSFLTAGVDTTISALCFAIRRFAEQPDQWQLLRENPVLARAAFDEVVRVDSPVIGFFRTTTRDTVIGSTTIPAEQKVMVFFAGANRDPGQWADPDRFDITRRTTGHTGFGTGIHNCAGQMVARLEAEALLQALAARVESWELTGTPALKLNNTLRALAHLPVRARRAADRSPAAAI